MAGMIHVGRYMTCTFYSVFQLTDICMWFHSSGLDHRTRGLCSVLLRGRMCLPSELLHECHQSRYCADSGKSQTAPDDRRAHCSHDFLWGLIYVSCNHRCILSTQTWCPSPAAPPHSFTASQCFTLTTAPMSSSKSTATWSSEPAAVTDRPIPPFINAANLEMNQRRDDWLLGHQGAHVADWAFICCPVFMTSSWASHMILTTTTAQSEPLVAKKGWTKEGLCFVVAFWTMWSYFTSANKTWITYS